LRETRQVMLQYVLFLRQQ